MAAILTNLRNTVIAGFVLALILFILYYGVQGYDGWAFGAFFFRWLHVLSGVMWIGLLYYFNFVQVQSLAEAATDDGGPGGAGITKYVAPRALFWFRWAALFTWLTGAIYLLEKGNLVSAFTLGLHSQRRCKLNRIRQPKCC